MSGLSFEVHSPVASSAPERADIACFVGFVRRRRTALSPEIGRFLFEAGWASLPHVRVDLTNPFDPLRDVPVPIESWNAFDRHFEWERRGRNNVAAGCTYLGAAVRSFFAQGGRKCYVVRVGNPWLPSTRRKNRVLRIPRLLPGFPAELDASAVDRSTWKGAAHLFGLPDVSYLCMPDLADAVATDATRLAPPVVPPPGQEQFVECSDAPPPGPVDRQMLSIAAPRSDETGYRHWALAIQRTAAFLRTRLREIQLIASVPLPHRNADVYHLGRRWLAEEGIYPFLVAGGFWKNIQSAFVQLVYPWVRTAGSVALPEGLESPDAVLAGIIARNTLLRGAFRSAAGLRLTDVDDVHPILGRGDLEARPPVAALRGIDTLGMIDRVSILGPTPGGLKVLSDVTTAPNESYRQAGVDRLFSVLLRAARRTGEAVMFEPSSERTWLALRRRLENLLIRLFRAGALRGERPRDAFTVRCDRTTMTQNDLDNGRIVAHLEFDAAPSIERIRVVLTLSEGGQVSLSAGGMT